MSLCHILVQLCVTPEMTAHQAPPSRGFSRQEHCSGLPCTSSGNLPNPGIELRSPTRQADSLLSEPPGSPQLPWNVDPKARRLLFDYIRLSYNFWEALATALQALSNYLKKPSAPWAVILPSHWHKVSNLSSPAAVQSPSPVWLFPTPWTAARQASLSLSISQSLPKFMSVASWSPIFGPKKISHCIIITEISFCSLPHSQTRQTGQSWIWSRP